MDNYKFNLENVNLGKVSENDFKESKSITLLKIILESNNKIKVRAQEADKIPDLDGTISILDDSKHERIMIHIQSKTLPIEYLESTPYTYDCDTKVFNVVKYEKVFSPVVLFLSDIVNEKLYYKLITREYIEILNYGDQNTKRIKFDDNDLYEEKKFISQLEEYVKKLSLVINKGEEALVTAYVNGPNSSYKMMQEELDKVNNLFDTKLKTIKDFLFPNVWKFGIAYNKNGNGYVMGLYKIYKGQNDTLVKNFDLINNNYFETIFVSDISFLTLSKTLNNFINKSINYFYNIFPLSPHICDEKILSEFIFTFLDNITHLSDKIKNNDNKYYKNEEEIDNVKTIINGLTKFYKIIWNDKDKYKDAKILEPFYNNTRKFLLCNRFINFKNEQKLLDKLLFEKDTSKFKENIFYDNTINISFAMLAIDELENRGIKKISRPYTNNKNFIKNIFLLTNESYKFIANKIGLTYNQKYNGEYYIKYVLNDELDYILTINDNKNDFQIYCDNISEEDFSNMKDDCNQVGTLKEYVHINYPLYHFVRLLINKKCMECQGNKFNFIPDSISMYSDDLPIISIKNS